MNPAAILALISDLYSQIQALSLENEALRKQRADDDTGSPNA
jgi:hypothetical protein